MDHPIARILLALAASATFACTPDGGDGGDPADPADVAPPEVDAALPTVPYEGEIDPLPAGSEVDEQSYFPAADGATWRYRRQTPMWQDPPPVTEGGESVMRPGEGEDEYVRRTVMVIDLPVDGEVQKVRQIIEETYVITPPDELVGPQVLVKAIDIEERTVEGELFVRTVSRSFDPPYVLFYDTWRTGLIGESNRTDMTTLTEVVVRRGDPEPQELEANPSISVITDTTPKILPMEGMYRDDVFQVDVSDDFANTISRTYWVQQGIGVVQWQYRDTNNIIYTMTENNVEAAPEDMPGDAQ